ncbi:dATP/dGTP diphosphohydrolase domain-containing protein [Zhongshania sp.]|uniref:dATP/dGTP diphosphohydrolase domain-containing protein n=1 Tax=Zhongshania sp. TaxID=1971902 RepID=UPI00356AFB64
MSSQSSKNVKQVDGKYPLQLINPLFIRGLSLALGEGAEKYGTRNYLVGGMPITEYVGALRRHLEAFATGEDIDPDSGLPHLIKLAAGCQVVMEVLERHPEDDDRQQAYRCITGITKPDHGLGGSGDSPQDFARRLGKAT